MATFGLEDVRESFSGDVSRFLADVEKNAKTIVSTATVALPAERTWQAPIETMVVGLHGIAGSSSLIGLDSMSVTARQLEDIAVAATESVRMLKFHASRLKRIASLCIDGSAELRIILEHELGGRGGEANKRSAALNAKLDAAVKKLDTDEQPASGATAAPGTQAVKVPTIPPKLDASASASSADEGWDEPAAAGSSPDVQAKGSMAQAAAQSSGGDDELVAVFREEARETLNNLQGYVGRLEVEPSDREAAIQCARLLHLLKGAAASVGQTAISQRAGELHKRTEDTNKRGLTAANVVDLRRAVEELFALTFGPPVAAPPAAAAPAIAIAPPAAPAAPASASQSGSQASAATTEEEETRNIFLEEARRALEDLRALVRQIQDKTNPARGVSATRAERVLHRLKGSAMIVGEAQTAAVAARGQTICEALDNVDGAALAALVEQLASMVQAPAPSAVPSRAAPVSEPTRHRFTLPASEEWDVYLEESSTLLDDLDRILIKLEKSSRPNAELSTMFRMYHTLKGASNAVGLAPLGRQLHIIEAFIERVVAGSTLPDLRQVVKVLADEHASLRSNIARAQSQGVLEVDLARTTSRLGALGKQQSSTGTSWIADSDPVWASSAAESRRGSSAHESSKSHASRGMEHESAASAQEISTGTEGVGERRFIRVAADRLDGLLDLVGELVVARSRILARIDRMQNLQDVDQDRQSVVIRLVDDFATSTQFANLDGGRRRGGRQAAREVVAPAVASGSVANGFGALELDHYEEIHVLSRQLDEATSDIAEMRREIASEMQRLTEDSEALSSVIADLQSEITQARMLTLDTLFTRLQLPVRDAAQRTGREVEIVVRGEQVAIDKSISDALFGPLLHMVRNAVAHGIEAPDRRRQLGKPAAGTLTLAARQDHGQVVLEVSDDGAGIDTAKLKAIGVQRGLVDASVAETDSRVLELVFVHGISTSAATGDVAGRGVGGNVVRRAIDRLNGSIEIQTTPGMGTTFRISLPLSMSITQAVLVRSGGVTMALPITFAERILTREGIEAVDTFGRNRVKVGDHLVAVHDTRSLFTGDGPRPESVLVVCVVGGERIAIEADEVVGQEEIVVKSLGNLLDGHPLFSGSTQRGDGELVLIVDVPGVLAAETAEEQRGEARAPASTAQSAAPSAAQSTEAEPNAAQADVPAKIAIAEVAPLPADKLRVLFVDDSLSVRKVAERMLLGLGVEIVTAVDGQDALEKLRTMSFSLVFTDLEMPRMHGYELIREMQYLPAYKAIPVVVISSRSGQKHIDQAIDLGAREYLTKPFSPEILGSVLERLAVRGTQKVS